MINFTLDGTEVSVADEASSLLDALREDLGCRTPKDGCAPQGQCGCCTVWVDDAPRVSCVTPVRRVAGRRVTTIDGLEAARRARWADAFVAAGASQCGFCTPGIVMRLAALERKGRADDTSIRSALAAHLCRCTGWQTIVEAARSALGHDEVVATDRDPLLGAWRAQLEGPRFQSSGPDVVCGHAGFADDRAPAGALVALGNPEGGYGLGTTLAEARRQGVRVQGRNSTVALRHPIEVAPGDWDLALRTTWVEPAYLEPDASWCEPYDAPASPLANGGAFGAKRDSEVGPLAASLAAEHGRAVRVLWPREMVVRQGPKRPPVAIGLRRDGTGVLRVALAEESPALAEYAARVQALLPGVTVEGVAVAGPPTSVALRASGWAEAAVARAGLEALRDGSSGPGHAVHVALPGRGAAAVSVAEDGVSVEVVAGEVLDEVVLRSYCIGAVHQALGWVWREGIAVDGDGVVHDLTIRSFGILSARETPPVEVTIRRSDRWPVNGSDAVFAATAASAWIGSGLAARWPTRR